MVSCMASASDLAAAVRGWPDQVVEITYPAQADNSKQPALMYAAGSQEARPLLVGLHTWSGNYKQGGAQATYARWCIDNGWHFIHPNFRGPNKSAEACGSDLVVSDIVDAVAHMVAQHNVDPTRVYLIGCSGGGHAALLMAARAPQLWAGVSAWVPISDVNAWWEQCHDGKYQRYAKDIEMVLGSRPDQNEAARTDALKRSPITYLDQASGVNLDINAGVKDGTTGGSVPFTQSLLAFNKVVGPKHQIDPGLIDAFYATKSLPKGLQAARPDPLYGRRSVIFRKAVNNTRVTIFNGGHEIIHVAGLNWLEHQRRGQPAVWELKTVRQLETGDREGDSGK